MTMRAPSRNQARARPRNRRGWWLLATAAAAALLNPQARAQQAPSPPLDTAPARADDDPRPVYRITLPVIFQGVYLGDVPVILDGDETVSVDQARFAEVLGPRLSPRTRAELRTLGAGADYLPLAALEAIDLRVAYDSATLELIVSAPTDRWGAVELPLVQAPRSQASANALKPESVSMSATLTAQQTYDWGDDGQSGEGPLRASADVSVNLFGLNGFYLFGQAEYDEAQETPFRRGDVILIKDDQRRAIRYGLGDFTPGRTGYQTAPTLGGLTFGTQYQDLQPFRNIRPSGRYRFVIEQASTVEVIVNGVAVRTLRLEAGAYDLRDFPFYNGLNEVQLFAIDPSGRRLLASFSQFSNTDLLERGVDDFSVSLGYRQERDGNGDISYDDEEPILMGFWRSGVAQQLTLGANVQWSENYALVGADAVFGAALGVIGLDLAWSDAKTQAAQGYAARGSYELAGEVLGFDRLQLNLEYDWRSEDFRSFDDADVRPYETEARAALFGQFAGGFGFGISGSQTRGVAGSPDQTRYAASVGRNIGRARVTVSADYLEETGQEPEESVLLTVSLPIGRRQSLRGGVESGAEERAFVEYSRFQTRDLGDYGYDVAIEQRPGGLSGSGSITYNANRAFLRAQHRVITDEDGEDILTEESALSVSTQIAFAGGALAIGRPVGSSFVIVKRHETLDEARVGVRRATRTARAEARAGAFGPALTSIGSAYTPQTMFVDVEDAPEGYDYGPGLYEIFSGPASGHVIQLGSDANRVAIGAITRPDGTPIGLLGGRLRNLDNPEIAEAFVFTNAAGRFVLTGLAPGRHQIVLGQRGEVVFEITIPAEGERIVDLGSIIVE